MIKLLYDKNDLQHSTKVRDDRFSWLKELDATELADGGLHAPGFLFGYEHGDEHYRNLLQHRPNVHDRPNERQELVRLDDLLKRPEQLGVEVPTPKTWIIGIDDRVPADLEFPVLLIAADFIRYRRGAWYFLEAGPGATSGTAHEGVFKSVAERLRSGETQLQEGAVGGPL